MEMKELCPPLNLPPAKLDIRKSGESYTVWCVIRKKNLLLTPEEWVRQHVVHFLIHQRSISIGKIASERLLKINGHNRRCDLMVVDTFGNPQLIIECKAASITLDEKTFLQTSNYVRETSARYFWMTNGLKHVLVDCEKPGEVLAEFPVF